MGERVERVEFSYTELLVRYFPFVNHMTDGDLKLELMHLSPRDNVKDWVPSFHFFMLSDDNHAGQIRLRVGRTPELLLYRGHIGYEVEPEYRGRHFAARSVMLLLPLVRALELRRAVVTCDPENLPSRRSIEIAGGIHENTVEVPETEPMYMAGARQRMRYVFHL
jgi:tagatose 1,6-diphosphate aldolase